MVQIFKTGIQLDLLSLFVKFDIKKIQNAQINKTPDYTKYVCVVHSAGKYLADVDIQRWKPTTSTSKRLF